MSMTREEAIKTIEFAKTYISKDGMIRQALELALSALRPVSRERVEKVWKGEWKPTESPYMNECEDCSVCGYRTVWDHGFDFCPMCGAPMTDEAVEMVMERLEEFHGQENP